MRIPPPQLVARHAATAVVWLLAAAAAVTAAGLWVWAGSFVLNRITSPEVGMHTDWETFWLSAVALDESRSIYLDTGAALVNLNPPIMTVVLAWAGWMDFWTSYRLWLLISVALTVASLAIVAAELRTRPAVAVTATAATMVSAPVLATLGLGQIYPLLMLGLAAAWVLGRRGHPALEGVVLGVTIALKPSLAPLLLIPLVRRHWDTLAAGITAGGLTTLVGWIAAGIESLPTWVDVALAHPLQTFFDNASLPGTIARLTSDTGWGRPVIEIPGGEWIGYGLGALAIALTAWMVRRPPADGPDTAVWAMTAAALLASPISWHTYLMILAPGVLVLAAARRWAVAALLLALALIGMDWTPLWYGDDGSASAVPLSLYCAILAVYLVALLPRRVGPWVQEPIAQAGEGNVPVAGPRSLVLVPRASPVPRR